MFKDGQSFRIKETISFQISLLYGMAEVEDDSIVKSKDATFLHTIFRNCQQFAERPALHWLNEKCVVTEQFSYKEVDIISFHIARRLLHSITSKWGSQIQQGQRAVLCCQPGLEFYFFFLGCLRAGIVPVPVKLPKELGCDAILLQQIVHDCNALFVLSNESNPNADLSKFIPIPWLSMKVVIPEITSPKTLELSTVTPKDVAFLQYNFGSTGNPQGAKITFDNLLHNMKLMKQSFQMDISAVEFTFLPHIDSLCLVGSFLNVLYSGATGYYMSPSVFLDSPEVFIQTLSKYKVTHAKVPRFAFNYILSTLDCYPSVESVCCIACYGPLTINTAQQFEFAIEKEGIIRVMYGLPEHVCFLSSTSSEDKLEVDEKGRISCGYPNVTVKIVDPDMLCEVEESELGEVWVDSKSKAAGYWRNDALDVFNAKLAKSEEKSYLRTGDLGYLRNGALFICDALRDIILFHGQVIYPIDIEILVQETVPEICPGKSVVLLFDPFDHDPYKVTVIAEVKTKKYTPEQLHTFCYGISVRISKSFQLETSMVIFTEPDVLPFTSSGKRERLLCKQFLEKNEIPMIFRWGSKGDRYVMLAATMPSLSLTQWSILPKPMEETSEKLLEPISAPLPSTFPPRETKKQSILRVSTHNTGHRSSLPTSELKKESSHRVTFSQAPRLSLPTQLSQIISEGGSSSSSSPTYSPDSPLTPRITGASCVKQGEGISEYFDAPPHKLSLAAPPAGGILRRVSVPTRGVFPSPVQRRQQRSLSMFDLPDDQDSIEKITAQVSNILGERITSETDILEETSADAGSLSELMKEEFGFAVKPRKHSTTKEILETVQMSLLNEKSTLDDQKSVASPKHSKYFPVPPMHLSKDSLPQRPALKPLSSVYKCECSVSLENVAVTKHDPLDVAIVGMSCSFPGCENLDEFWQLLSSNDTSTVTRLDHSTKQTYTAGFSKSVGRFDDRWFGVPEWELPLVDPQQAMLLHSAWECMLNAGYAIPRGEYSNCFERWGVFVGSSSSNAAANRVARYLNFHGPTITVNTACASSLTALDIAYLNVRTGRCNAALVCGVNALLNTQGFSTLKNLEMLSPDQKTRVFDESAKGFIRGEGSGSVLLMPICKARIDYRRILAVIKSVYSNNNGNESVHFTAPNRTAQKNLVSSALAVAALYPEEVAYIEADAKGTKWGDSAEIDTIKEIFGSKDFDEMETSDDTKKDVDTSVKVSATLPKLSTVASDTSLRGTSDGTSDSAKLKVPRVAPHNPEGATKVSTSEQKETTFASKSAIPATRVIKATSDVSPQSSSKSESESIDASPKSVAVQCATHRHQDTSVVVGSVKANIGHLEAAAGIASLIKTVMVLEHAEAPGNPCLKHINPAANDKKITFPKKTTDLSNLKQEGKLISAIVNSFGFTGTNVTAVLEQYSILPDLAGVSCCLLLEIKDKNLNYQEILSDLNHEFPLTSNAIAHFEKRLKIVCQKFEKLQYKINANAGVNMAIFRVYFALITQLYALRTRLLVMVGTDVLGEVTALLFAGSLSLDDALAMVAFPGAILKERKKLMKVPEIKVYSNIRQVVLDEKSFIDFDFFSYGLELATKIQKGSKVKTPIDVIRSKIPECNLLLHFTTKHDDDSNDSILISFPIKMKTAQYFRKKYLKLRSRCDTLRAEGMERPSRGDVMDHFYERYPFRKIVEEIDERVSSPPVAKISDDIIVISPPLGMCRGSPKHVLRQKQSPSPSEVPPPSEVASPSGAEQSKSLQPPSEVSSQSIGKSPTEPKPSPTKRKPGNAIPLKGRCTQV